MSLLSIISFFASILFYKWLNSGEVVSYNDSIDTPAIEMNQLKKIG